jgi:putative peptidoglycan lipid II flippase
MALLMVAQVLDKGLYLVREGLVTARFGASAVTDAFAVGLYVSSFILALLRPLIEDTLIPVYVGRLATDARSARRLLQAVGVLILGLTGLLALLAAVFASQIAQFVAPGFSAGTAAVSVQVIRVMALFALVLGMTNFALSVLSAHRAYIVVGLSPLCATVVVILTLWLFSQSWGIHSLSWGMVVGRTVQLVVLALALRQRGLLSDSWKTVIHTLGPTLRSELGTLGRFTGLMVLVRLVSMGVGWLDRSLGSRLIEGSVASLAFAMNVYQLPLQVCVLAVTTVAIVQFSWHVALGDVKELVRDVNLALRIAGFFLIPATVALILLSGPIVRVLYERGLFDAQDTAMTASVLAFYALGLFPQAVAIIIVRLFLARQEAHLVLFIFGVGAVVHALLDLVLVGPMQQAGIALATTVGVGGMAVVSLVLARRRLGPLGGRVILFSLLRSGLAAAGMGAGVYAVLRFGSALPNVWLLVACTMIGLAAYGMIGYLIKTPELRILVASVTDFVERSSLPWKAARSGMSGGDQA